MHCLHYSVGNEYMEQPEITFEKLPEAIAIIMAEVVSIRKLLEERPAPIPPVLDPIDIDEACQLIMKSKSTVYSLVRKQKIPCYKAGKKLYFYKTELLDWITSGKKKCIAETKEDIRKQMERSARHKPAARNH